MHCLHTRFLAALHIHTSAHGCHPRGHKMPLCISYRHVFKIGRLPNTLQYKHFLQLHLLFSKYISYRHIFRCISLQTRDCLHSIQTRPYECMHLLHRFMRIFGCIPFRHLYLDASFHIICISCIHIFRCNWCKVAFLSNTSVDACNSYRHMHSFQQHL
jgi:hypothetical protein